MLHRLGPGKTKWANSTFHQLTSAQEKLQSCPHLRLWLSTVRSSTSRRQPSESKGKPIAFVSSQVFIEKVSKTLAYEEYAGQAAFGTLSRAVQHIMNLNACIIWNSITPPAPFESIESSQFSYASDVDALLSVPSSPLAASTIAPSLTNFTLLNTSTFNLRPIYSGGRNYWRQGDDFHADLTEAYMETNKVSNLS